MTILSSRAAPLAASFISVPTESRHLDFAPQRAVIAVPLAGIITGEPSPFV
jgi:hypothetical protein